MYRFFVLIFLFLFIGVNNVFALEIEKANDNYNVVFVKNKRLAKRNKAMNKVKVDNNKATKPVDSNTKIYASATGNISSEDANHLLTASVGDNKSASKINDDKKNEPKVPTKTKKKTKVMKKNTKAKDNSQSKVVVSYNGDRIVIDNELCKMVARNDVVNVKKILSMMKYESRYVNWRCENNTPLLLLAVEHNNLLVAKFLLEKGANVNLFDDAGVTSLHWIARSSSSDIMDMFALIISVDDLMVDIRDIEGYTPLMRAVEFENVDIVNALLKKRSDVDIKNNYGESAVMLARKRFESKKDYDDRTNIERILKLFDINV